jgi:hypothetical protein
LFKLHCSKYYSYSLPELRRGYSEIAYYPFPEGPPAEANWQTLNRLQNLLVSMRCPPHAGFAWWKCMYCLDREYKQWSACPAPPSGARVNQQHQCTSCPFCPLDGLRFFIRHQMGFITILFFLLLTTVLFLFFFFLLCDRFSLGPDLTGV